MAGIIFINGSAFPAPDMGLSEIVATAVSGGKNAQAEFVGQKVGRDQYKLNNLKWHYLDAATWASMLQQFSNFKVTARIPDMVRNDWITIQMYPGDRSADIFEIEPDTINGSANARAGLPKSYMNCKVNIVDCGVV